MTDNVIQFPKVKVDAPPQSKEELEIKFKEFKSLYSEEVAEFIWRNVLGELIRSGCDFSKDMETYFPSMVLVLEAVRSLHLQSQGIHHPLQEFAKDSLDIQDNIASFEEKMVDIDEEMD